MSCSARPTGSGELSFKIGADGAVGLRYRLKRFDRTNRADISAGYDGDDRIQVRALLTF